MKSLITHQWRRISDVTLFQSCDYDNSSLPNKSQLAYSIYSHP